MKKSILIGLFCLFAISIFAQDKPIPVSTSKPQYQLNPTKNVKLSFSVTAQQINDFLVVDSYGVAAIESSDKLTGAQISSMKLNHKIVLDSITNRYGAFIKADQAQITADTLKKHLKK